MSISPASALAVRSISVCRDILSFEYWESSHPLFPFQICCYTLALAYLSAVVWTAQHLCCSGWIPAVQCASVKPCFPAAGLGLPFPGAPCLLHGKNTPGYWGNSNIPHHLSGNAGNCPPPKAFCMTCFVRFTLGLLSSGNRLALQGVFYLDECTTSSP